MKKRILLFTAASAMAVISLTSGQNGAGAESGYNATGSETGLMNPTGCSAPGASCHGASGAPTTGITVALELDSAGVAMAHYTGGHTYTVKITGTNTTSNNLPRFGFQVSCIQGTTAQVTPTNAGTFASTGLPTSVRYTAARPSFFVCNLVEHSVPISPTTGTGATGSTYVESFQWTAPAAGTGSVSFWGAVNAVNFDGSAGTGDKWNTNHIVITEHTASVASVQENFAINAFPNPVSNTLNLQFTNAAGQYNITVYDMTGRAVHTQTADIASVSQVSINTSNWAAGIYQVVAEKDGSRKVMSVVK